MIPLARGRSQGFISGRAAASVAAGWLAFGGWAGSQEGRPGIRERILADAFPGARIVADRVYLTEEQAERIRDLSGLALPTRIYARFLAVRDGDEVGRAYAETHVVRTKRQTLLISLEPDGRIRRVDVTAFLEPREYLPSEPWRRQYASRALDDDLALGRGIQAITGATLTARAVNAAARRVLALDQVLRTVGPGAP